MYSIDFQSQIKQSGLLKMTKRGRWDDSSDEEPAPKIVTTKKEKKQDNIIHVDETHQVKEAEIKCAPSPSNNDKIEKENIALISDSGHTIFANKKVFDYNPAIHGCRSIDEYQRISFISQGTYGLVYKARCLKTNDIVAIKEVKLTPDSRKVGFPIPALREINVLLSLQHPNIIRVREMVVGSSLDKTYMVMDYYDYDLKTCMDMSRQSFSTAEIKQLMVQLLSAIHYMHSNWYIHRDLKTSNILYSNNSGNLCVCDFGLARKYGSPIAPYTFEVVTLWYRAPELLLGSRIYSTSLDMWSVGCIFGEMILGKPLFPGQGEIDQLTKIVKLLGQPNELNYPGVTSLPNANRISYKAPSRSKLRELFPLTSFSGGMSLNDAGFDLLTKLLIYDPKQRITAEEALKHPWLTSELPLPCLPENMPKFRSKDEINNDHDK